MDPQGIEVVAMLQTILVAVLKELSMAHVPAPISTFVGLPSLTPTSVIVRVPVVEQL